MILTLIGARRLTAAVKGWAARGLLPGPLEKWTPPEPRFVEVASVMPQVLTLVSLREWLRLAS